MRFGRTSILFRALLHDPGDQIDGLRPGFVDFGGPDFRSGEFGHHREEGHSDGEIVVFGDAVFGVTASEFGEISGEEVGFLERADDDGERLDEFLFLVGEFDILEQDMQFGIVLEESVIKSFGEQVGLRREQLERFPERSDIQIHRVLSKFRFNRERRC